LNLHVTVRYGLAQAHHSADTIFWMAVFSVAFRSVAILASEISSAIVCEQLSSDLVRKRALMVSCDGRQSNVLLETPDGDT